MAASLAAGEWLRAPTAGWAAAAGVFCGLTAAIGLGLKPRRPVPALLAAAAGLLLGVSHARLSGLNNDWPAIREARVVKASNRMAEELREARQLTDSLAARAVAVAGLPREAGFDALAALVSPGGLEAGVAVLDSTGAPRIWAGRFRLAPEAVGDSLGARLTPYYAVLEARRHAGAGRTAVASVLLAAGGAVPDADRSLAARYEEGTAVALRILPARLAPDSSDVFDYTERTSTGEERTLFSVQFEPDEQQESIEAERTAGGRRVAWAVLLALVAGIFFAPPGAGRVLVLAAALGFTLRAPLGGLLGLEPL
ncbi:MAG TPA: hypothetical protein VFN96_10200, partial [Gemmatimonadales bacterium]|nr:hypothetical protein [Gemmatimonadales bacterium]